MAAVHPYVVVPIGVYLDRMTSHPESQLYRTISRQFIPEREIACKSPESSIKIAKEKALCMCVWMELCVCMRELSIIPELSIMRKLAPSYRLVV